MHSNNENGKEKIHFLSKRISRGEQVLAFQVTDQPCLHMVPQTLPKYL